MQELIMPTGLPTAVPRGGWRLLETGAGLVFAKMTWLKATPGLW